MNETDPARREYGKARTSRFPLISPTDITDDTIAFTAARVLCCSKDAFEAAQKWEAARNSNSDPFLEDFRLEFARMIGSLAPAKLNRLPECGPGLDVLDEYLSIIARRDAEWRSCKADPERWLVVAHAELTVLELEQSLCDIVWIAIRNKDTDFAPPDWPDNSVMPGFKPRKPRELKDLNQWYRRKIPPFKIKIAGQRSWEDVARIAALVRFAEVFVGNDKIDYCRGCGHVFEAFRRSVFCSEKCAHRVSSRCSKEDNSRIQNRRRNMIATQALAGWLEKPKGKWRLAVEMKLASAFFCPIDHKSQWLGRCIVAAKLPHKSEKRIRLIELCTNKNASAQEVRRIRGEVNNFLRLINRADRVESQMTRKIQRL